jgi:hypothetical protein
MSNFIIGQPVIYMRSRSGARAAEEIECTYHGEVDFSWRERRHQVMFVENGKALNRFVSIHALRQLIVEQCQAEAVTEPRARE